MFNSRTGSIQDSISDTSLGQNAMINLTPMFKGPFESSKFNKKRLVTHTPNQNNGTPRLISQQLSKILSPKV